MNGPRHIGLIAQGGAGWAGGVEYVKNLLRAVGAAGGDECVLSLICSGAALPEWQAQIDHAHHLIALSKPARRSLLDRFCAPNRHFISPVKAAGIDFLYPLTYDNAYNVGLSFPLGERIGPARWAGWIPDFQHRHLPHLFSEKEIAKRERGIAQLVREAPRVVLSSASAAEDFRRFFPSDAHKAEVLTFATFPHADWYEDGTCAEDLSWLPERFFLVSNQFWKHKNHLAVFEALRLLRGRGIRPVVVCTGQLHDFRDPDYANTILQAVHRFGIASQVLLLGLAARRTQIELMRRCLAVVQPSLFEGWSTVVEDARALGKACILSDLDVHREQNPSGARFFARDSTDALAEQMAEAWEMLRPGPDREAESSARQRAEERIAEVGRSFLAIAERAMWDTSVEIRPIIRR